MRGKTNIEIYLLISLFFRAMNCTTAANIPDQLTESYYSGDGGGMYNYHGSPTVSNCKFIGNKAKGYGGGIHNELDSSQTFVNCHLNGNSAYAGGGISNQTLTSPTLINCCISGNSAYSYGGGMRNYNECSPTVVNCIFSGNTSATDVGGGIYNKYSSNPVLTNCILSGNIAAQAGGGMANGNTSSPTVTNCILWGETPDEIYCDLSSTPIVTYSDVQGGRPDEGNIDADPQFQGADLRLMATSPCIDAGDNDSVPVVVTTDLDGNPRIIDGDCDDIDVVDMGAYEFSFAYVGDFDNNCSVDFFDVSILARAWETEEGDPDWNWACDISYPPDDYIDWRDVAVVCDNWLAAP